jgi:hypothetical protein
MPLLHYQEWIATLTVNIAQAMIGKSQHHREQDYARQQCTDLSHNDFRFSVN